MQILVSFLFLNRFKKKNGNCWFHELDPQRKNLQELTSDSMEHKRVGSGEVTGLWAGAVIRRVTVGSAHVFSLVLGAGYVGVFSL